MKITQANVSIGTFESAVVLQDLRFQVDTGSWFSKKQKFICLKEDLIQVLNSEKQKKNIFEKRYQDLLGITKSLMQGEKNFVVHFKQNTDEEWTSN